MFVDFDANIGLVKKRLYLFYYFLLFIILVKMFTLFFDEKYLFVIELQYISLSSRNQDTCVGAGPTGCPARKREDLV